MGSYGININCAATIDEDGMTSIGLHVKDSSGLNIDRSAKGEDFNSVIKSLSHGVLKEVSAENDRQRKEAEAKAAERKKVQDEISKLEAQIADYEKQLADLKGKAEKKPTKKPKAAQEDYASSIINDILSAFPF